VGAGTGEVYQRKERASLSRQTETGPMGSEPPQRTWGQIMRWGMLVHLALYSRPQIEEESRATETGSGPGAFCTGVGKITKKAADA